MVLKKEVEAIVWEEPGLAHKDLCAPRGEQRASLAIRFRDSPVSQWK